MSALLRPVLVVLGVIGLAVAARWFGADQLLEVEAARRLIESHDRLGPVIFVGICVGGMLINVPESLLLAAGGALFGMGPGLLYGWVASVMGTTATFLIVRHGFGAEGRAALVRRFGVLGRLDQQLVRHGFRTILLLRTILFVAPPLNWGMGATSVPLRSYVAGTALGVLPGLVVVTMLGRELALASATGDWTRPALLVPGAVFALMLVGSALVARRAFRGP